MKYKITVEKEKVGVDNKYDAWDTVYEQITENPEFSVGLVVNAVNPTI